MQVIQTFGIRDLFHGAINPCTDIIDSDFPLLSKNKSSGGGNVSRITTTVHHHYMIYIACLYQARVMMKKLDPSYSVPSFDFKSFPILKDMFHGIENHLKRLVSGLKSETDRKQKALVLVKDL